MLAVVYLAFLSSLLLVPSEAALACGANECVPGVENLGRGYDLVKGSLKLVNVVDLETPSSTKTYTNPYKNTTYGIPPSVNVVNTPSYDVDSFVFRSSHDFASRKSLDVGVAFGVGWDESSLSLDVEVQKVQAILTSGDKLAAFAREIQSVYTAQLAPYDQLTLTDQFHDDIAQLPADFEAESYQNFIDKYGTHVVQWGLFGGEVVMTCLVAADASAEYSDLTVSLTLKLQLAVLKGSVEVSYNKDGYNANMDKYIAFNNVTYFGGNPTLGSVNYSSWVNSVRFSPTFIRSNVVNITKFVKDELRRDNLMTQINAYAQANIQEDVFVRPHPMKLAWGNTTTADPSQTCEDLGMIVVGTQLDDDDGESIRPFDCSTPCLSLSAWGAWEAHDWVDSTQNTKGDKAKDDGKGIWQGKGNEGKAVVSDECMSASFQCGNGQCLPGLDDLGIGFDAVFGRRKVVPVLQYTYNNGFAWQHPVTGESYIYPDQVSVFDDVSDTTSTQVISSQQGLSDYYSGHFGLRIGVPGLFTFGYQTQSSSSVYYSGEALMSITQEDTSFYEVVVSQVQPSDGLTQSVDKLPSEYIESAYAAFVDSYGTHYIEQATFGGKTLMTNVIDQSYYSNKAESSFGVDANVMFGGYKAGGSVGSQSDQEYVQYDSSTFSQFNVLGGDYQYYSMNSSQSWSDWEATLTCNPAAISQDLNPIVDLVNLIDKTKGENLNTYINLYMEKAQASFDQKAVGVAQTSSTEMTDIVISSDLYVGCAGNTTLVGFDGLDEHHGNYYNLQPSHCTQFTWNEAAIESGHAGPIFVNPNTCFQATEQTSSRYTGCPPNTWAVGMNSYNTDHNGVVGKSPMICCSLAFFPNTTTAAPPS